MSKIIGTYKITNILTGKYYYGSTDNIPKRLQRHKRELRQEKHHCIYLQRAYNKYGDDNFTFEKDKLYDTVEEARDTEQHVLDTVEDLYNVSRCASGGDLISNHPNKEEIVKKMTESIRKRYAEMTPEERKLKYGKPCELNGMYGKTHTEEVKQRLSQIHKGKVYRSGFKLSDEQKAKISERAKKRTGDKNPFYGKTHSEQTRKKISEKNKGNIPPNAKEIIIDGVEYRSLAEASRQLNIPVPTIHYRIKKNYPNYSHK